MSRWQVELSVTTAERLFNFVTAADKNKRHWPKDGKGFREKGIKMQTNLLFDKDPKRVKNLSKKKFLLIFPNKKLNPWKVNFASQIKSSCWSQIIFCYFILILEKLSDWS